MSAYRAIWGLKLITKSDDGKGNKREQIVTLAQAGLMTRDVAESVAIRVQQHSQTAQPDTETTKSTVVVYNSESI